MENNTTTEKDFDCIKFVNEQRERIAAVTKDMTTEEVVAYFKKASENSKLRERS
jgi:hypothetical protein